MIPSTSCRGINPLPQEFVFGDQAYLTSFECPSCFAEPWLSWPIRIAGEYLSATPLRELNSRFLIAVTFPLLYGAMFGDVGHGLVLAAIGWFLSRRSTLGGLLVACGLSGTIFGFIYGSVFGFEEVLPHIPFGRFVLIQPVKISSKYLALPLEQG